MEEGASKPALPAPRSGAGDYWKLYA